MSEREKDMSKRYVIQVKAAAFGQEPEWLNLQHPNGGDWMTRSRSTAIADAARLVQAGETRELRVMLSRPVYELVDAGVTQAVIDAVLADHLETVNDDDDDDDEQADATYDK